MRKPEDLEEDEAIVKNSHRNWEIVEDNWSDVTVFKEDTNQLLVSFSSLEKKKIILPMFEQS